MDVTLPVRREAPRLAVRAGACALPVLAFAAPLGLPHLRLAPFVAAVAGRPTHPAGAEAVDFLAVALGRAAVLLPVGDLTFRLSLLGAVLGALGLSLWARVGLELSTWLRPPPRARLGPKEVAHEPVAALGAVSAVALSEPVFRQSTASAELAFAFCLVAGWAWSVTLLLREPADARAALGAAFVAGLTAVTAPGAATLLLPPGVAFWIWGLRRRSRWALLAPCAFVLGTAPGLAGAATGGTATAALGGWFELLSLGAFRRAMVQVGLDVWLDTALALADALGVMAALLAVLGLGVLAGRVPSWGGLVLFALWAGVLGAAGAGAHREVPLALFLGFLIPALVAGILHFSGKLGRARLATALALAVMCVVAPAASGGWARWRPDGRLPLRLLTRAQWRLPTRSSVDPGSEELRLVFAYGTALGVRPDLDVRPGASVGLEASSSP